MTDSAVVMWLLVTLFVGLGGLAKGMIGLGLPLVSVPLLSYMMSVREAIALMVIPMVMTNMYQMFNRGRLNVVVSRFWLLLVGLMVGIAVGGYFLTALSTSALEAILGTVVLLSSLMSLLRGTRGIPRHVESWANPTVGFGAGILGGIAGLWGAPLGAYLAALEMDKEDFIASIGVSFSIASVALLITLIAYGAFGLPQWITSGIAALPALAGLFVGQTMRRFVSQEGFRRVVLGTLMITGVLLIYRSLKV